MDTKEDADSRTLWCWGRATDQGRQHSSVSFHLEGHKGLAKLTRDAPNGPITLTFPGPATNTVEISDTRFDVNTGSLHRLHGNLFRVNLVVALVSEPYRMGVYQFLYPGAPLAANELFAFVNAAVYGHCVDPITSVQIEDTITETKTTVEHQAYHPDLFERIQLRIRFCGLEIMFWWQKIFDRPKPRYSFGVEPLNEFEPGHDGFYSDNVSTQFTEEEFNAAWDILAAASAPNATKTALLFAPAWYIMKKAIKDVCERLCGYHASVWHGYNIINARKAGMHNVHRVTQSIRVLLREITTRIHSKVSSFDIPFDYLQGPTSQWRPTGPQSINTGMFNARHPFQAPHPHSLVQKSGNNWHLIAAFDDVECAALIALQIGNARAHPTVVYDPKCPAVTLNVIAVDMMKAGSQNASIIYEAAFCDA